MVSTKKIIKSPDDVYFRETGLYQQLLMRRKAQPIGIISVIMKYVWWGLLLIPALMAQNTFFSILAVTAVFLVPLVISLAVLLYFLPTTFMRDTDEGLLSILFAAPVPASDIVNSLRIFYGYHSVKLMLPVCIIDILLNLLMLISGLPDNGLQGISWFIFFSLVWWLLLESSIAAASFSKHFAQNTAIILVMVVPVLTVVYFAGTGTSDLVWSVFNIGNLIQTYINSDSMLRGMNEHALPGKVHSILTSTFMGLYLLIPVLWLYLKNPRFMESRRTAL